MELSLLMKPFMEIMEAATAKATRFPGKHMLPRFQAEGADLPGAEVQGRCGIAQTAAGKIDFLADRMVPDLRSSARASALLSSEPGRAMPIRRTASAKARDAGVERFTARC